MARETSPCFCPHEDFLSCALDAAWCVCVYACQYAMCNKIRWGEYAGENHMRIPRACGSGTTLLCACGKIRHAPASSARLKTKDAVRPTVEISLGNFSRQRPAGCRNTRRIHTFREHHTLMESVVILGNLDFSGKLTVSKGSSTVRQEMEAPETCPYPAACASLWGHRPVS